MNSLKVYGQPFRAANCSVKHTTIIVATKHPFQHYQGYCAIWWHVDVTKHPSHWETVMPQTTPSIEWLPRLRRAVLFLDTCNLAVQRTSSSKKTAEILGAVRQRCNIDHATILIGPTGSVFILNEPYYRVDNEDEALKSLGLVSIEIPISLSPYCGKWDDKKGSLPATQSFLITEAKNTHELNDIARRLKAASLAAPAWNDMAGVSYE